MAGSPDHVFRPRDLAQIPADFGRNQGLAWRAPASTGPGDVERHHARVLAARLQHGAMLALRNRSKGAAKSDAFLAPQIGMSADRLGRIRRGDLPMRLEEIGVTCVVLNVDFMTVVEYARLARSISPAPSRTANPIAPHGQRPTDRGR